MQLDKIITEARALAQTYRITKGDTFRLQDTDPEDTAGLEAEDKPRAQERLQTGVQALTELQDRLYERIDTPERQWKLSAADVRERSYWHNYMAAYEAMIRHTATEDAPWYVVPADHKWFTRLVVAATVIEVLASLNVHYPQLDAAARKELAWAQQALLEE